MVKVCRSFDVRSLSRRFASENEAGGVHLSRRWQDGRGKRYSGGSAL